MYYENYAWISDFSVQKHLKIFSNFHIFERQRDSDRVSSACSLFKCLQQLKLSQAEAIFHVGDRGPSTCIIIYCSQGAHWQGVGTGSCHRGCVV